MWPVFWNSINVSLLTKFCMNKEALYEWGCKILLNTMAWLPLSASSLHPLLGSVHHGDGAWRSDQLISKVPFTWRSELFLRSWEVHCTRFYKFGLGVHLCMHLYNMGFLRADCEILSNWKCPRTLKAHLWAPVCPGHTVISVCISDIHNTFYSSARLCGRTFLPLESPWIIYKNMVSPFMSI